jgi:phosphatidylglycerophosphate synthase
MRKIPCDLENPIDNVLYDLSDWMCPFFYKTGHTPNMITTYSLITGVLSCYFLWKGHILLFGIFYAISFFFDCMDGHFARKYNMTSKFGDMYDHIKDNIVALSILFVISLCKKPTNIPIKERTASIIVIMADWDIATVASSRIMRLSMLQY